MQTTDDMQTHNNREKIPLSTVTCQPEHRHCPNWKIRSTLNDTENHIQTVTTLKFILHSSTSFVLRCMHNIEGAREGG